MLFGIDKWPSGDGRERDEARSDRDRQTNDCKSGFKYGIKQYKIKENASFFLRRISLDSHIWFLMDSLALLQQITVWMRGRRRRIFTAHLLEKRAFTDVVIHLFGLPRMMWRVSSHRSPSATWHTQWGVNFRLPVSCTNWKWSKFLEHL